MKKIKETLIHWLGGYTEKDKFEGTFNMAFSAGTKLGRDAERNEIKEFADSLFGLNADEWCKKMYEFIVDGNGSAEEKEV